jgi:hypothetical protein
MRYDTKITFLEKSGNPVYDEATGNTKEPEPLKVTAYGSVAETALDARELMYGSVLVKSITAHIQGPYPGDFERLEGAEVNGKKYELTEAMYLRAKTVFYLREV